MNDAILMVQEVSDGLLIQFKGSGICYFSTKFLVGAIGRESNQIFLDHDQSAIAEQAEDGSMGVLLQYEPVFVEAAQL